MNKKEIESHLVFNRDEKIGDTKTFTVPKGYLLLSIHGGLNENMNEATISFSKFFKKYYYQQNSYNYGMIAQTKTISNNVYIAESCDIPLEINIKAENTHFSSEIDITFTMFKITDYWMDMIDFIDNIDGVPVSIPRYHGGFVYYLF